MNSNLFSTFIPFQNRRSGSAWNGIAWLGLGRGMVDFRRNFVAFPRIDDIFSNDETATFISFLFSSSSSSFSSLHSAPINQSTDYFLFSIGIVAYSNDDDDDHADAEQWMLLKHLILSRTKKYTAIDMLSSFCYRFCCWCCCHCYCFGCYCWYCRCCYCYSVCMLCSDINVNMYGKWKSVSFEESIHVSKPSGFCRNVCRLGRILFFRQEILTTATKNGDKNCSR